MAQLYPSDTTEPFFTRFFNKNFSPNNYKNRGKLRLILSLLLLLSILQARATSYTSVKDGNWNDPATWTNAANPPANAYPLATDIVTIDGHTVTLTADAACTSLTINPILSTLAINTNKLAISGAFIFTAPGNGGNQTSVLNIGSGLVTAGSFILNGGGGHREAKVLISSGTFEVNGDFTFTRANGASDINSILEFTGAGVLKVKGVLNDQGDFRAGTASTILFNGNAPQTIPTNYVYANLQTGNDYGVGINGPLTPANVKKDITVTAGIFDNNGNAISGTNGTNSTYPQRFQVQAGATLVLEGTSTIPTGFSNIWVDPTSTVKYMGTNQSIASIDYGNLFIGGTGVKTLTGPISISQSLNLNTGSITLGNYDLAIKEGGSVANASATNYLKQSGTGKLIMEGIGVGGITTEVMFPIGTATTFTPAYITNASPKDNFSVRVADGIKDNKNVLITKHVVNKTWNVVQETSNAKANVTLKLQWNATDEVSPFDRNMVGVSHYYNNGWQQPSSFALANGTGPYQASISGLNSFSPFGVGDNVSPLPVELLSFKVTKQAETAFLQWETATEKDNKGFYVQTSTNGRDFENIGFVASANPNSNSLQRYEYLDKTSVQAGLRYYRLKQSDFSGIESFSAIKVIDFSKQESLTAFPNPFSNNFILNVEAGSNDQIAYQLVDLTGKVIFQHTEALLKGSNSIQVNVDNKYPAGLYLLQAQTNSQIYSSRIIKQ